MRSKTEYLNILQANGATPSEAHNLLAATIRVSEQLTPNIAGIDDEEALGALMDYVTYGPIEGAMWLFLRSGRSWLNMPGPGERVADRVAALELLAEKSERDETIKRVWALKNKHGASLASCKEAVKFASEYPLGAIDVELMEIAYLKAKNSVSVNLKLPLPARVKEFYLAELRYKSKGGL